MIKVLIFQKENGYFKRKYLENLRKISCKCLNLEKINRLPIGDIGAQFLDLECKRNPEDSLDLWSQNMLLYFLLGKGNYTDEEKYYIMINTFIGKINDWFSGLTEDAEKIIKNDTLDGLKNSVQEGIANLKQYIANEFFGGQGNIKENKEVIRTIAKQNLGINFLKSILDHFRDW